MALKGRTPPSQLVIVFALLVTSGASITFGILLQPQSQAQAVDFAGATASPQRIPVSDPVWDLAFDAERDHIWLVIGNGEAAELTRISTQDVIEVEDAPRESWQLPPGEYSGVHREIRVLASGDPVVSVDYGIVRLDRESGTLLEVTFTLEVEDALAGALDPNSPLPGTWVSAIAVSGDRIFVARNNVPYLSVISSADMSVVDRIDVGAPLAGAHDLLVDGDQIRLRTAEGDVVQLGLEGLAPELLVDSVDGIIPDGTGAALAILATGEIVSLSSEGTAHAIGQAGWQAVLSPMPGGGFIAYDRQVGAILRHEADGAKAAALQLPLEERPARMGNESFSAPPNLTDLIVDRAGYVWYAVGDQPAIYRVVAP